MLQCLERSRWSVGTSIQPPLEGVIHESAVQGPEAIAMFEEHIRFMAMAEHELSEETTAAADQEAFNSHLNVEQINKVSSAPTQQRL